MSPAKCVRLLIIVSANFSALCSDTASPTLLCFFHSPFSFVEPDGDNVLSVFNNNKEANSMPDSQHLDLLKQGVFTWNQWRQEHPEVLPDLTGADMSWAHLSRIDLSGANLSGADFTWADLYKAD